MFRVANPDNSAPCKISDSDCTASWTYDGRDRLVKGIDGTGTTSDFTLDTIGNVTEEKRNGGSYQTATYNGQRLETSAQAGYTTVKYLYDSQGNVDCIVLATWASPSCPAVATGVTAASELVTDNVYDYRDRLVAIRGYNSGTAGDKSEYRYDPLARPIKKIATEGGTTTSTDMVYLGVSDAVVRETETGGSTKDRTYAFDALGDRTSLSEKVSGTTSRWSYVYDPLGSAEILIDQANTVKATYGYTAYGDKNTSLTKFAGGFSETTNPYRYTGKRWDPAAKAYDMGARTYYPGVGRWFQQDQYPDALQNLALSVDPLTQNRYAFTGANPINYVEFDGHGVGSVVKKVPNPIKPIAQKAAKKVVQVTKAAAAKTTAKAVAVATTAKTAVTNAATATKTATVKTATTVSTASATSWEWYTNTAVPWEQEQLNAAYHNEYVGACLISGATASVVSGPEAFPFACAGGITLAAWANQPGKVGASGKAASAFFDVWTIRGALHAGLKIPKFIDLLKQNGVPLPSRLASH